MGSDCVGGVVVDGLCWCDDWCECGWVVECICIWCVWL